MEHCFIGTSGWSYKHWKDIVYPPKLPATRWLSYYTQLFGTTEINNSFYRMPLQETVAAWTENTPPHFRFCPKMSRYLTHMKKLREPEEPLERFFEVFRPMEEKMGPVLVQLPPFLSFNYEVADYFFRLLRLRYKRYAFALEVRHPTWLEVDPLTLMAKYDIAFVIAQTGDLFPYSEMVTAKNIYVRFHGPKELYASSYSDEMLEGFAAKFRKWIAEGHVVWAYFNNDIHGYAPEDARRLMRLME